ncbi:MAG TPA: ATP synthase F0 subunit B [Polyangiales bacterium]
MLRIWLLILALGATRVLVPAVALAEEAAEAEPAAGHGAHGKLSFHEIAFGEEKFQFWGSIVNFGLLVYIIRRGAKKPLGAFLKERSDSIERGIAEAAATKRKAEALASEYAERMKTLDQELEKLRSDIARAAQEDKARIVAEAKEAEKRLRVETDALIAQQVEQLEAQIRREVVAAAMSAAERAVKESANADDQKRLAEAFARELAKPGPEKDKRA